MTSKFPNDFTNVWLTNHARRTCFLIIYFQVCQGQNSIKLERTLYCPLWTLIRLTHNDMCAHFIPSDTIETHIAFAWANGTHWHREWRYGWDCASEPKRPLCVCVRPKYSKVNKRQCERSEEYIYLCKTFQPPLIRNTHINFEAHNPASNTCFVHVCVSYGMYTLR